jgi:hypothetical protein
MLARRYLLCVTFLSVGFLAVAWTGPTKADERGDAISAARNIMSAMAQKNYSRLWDLTSDWFKARIGNNEPSFIANWTIQRQTIGALRSSTVLDVSYFTNDPSTNYTGKIYWVTFQNSYETGNAYEKIGVIEENGAFKLSGTAGAPAP